MFKILFVFLMSITSAFGQMDFCNKDLETFPVQAGGREKPLYVFANETIRFMTGSEKVGDYSATEAFCKLSLKAFGMPVELPVMIKVDHVDVRKVLGMQEDQTSIPVNELESKSDLITSELSQLKENNSFKKELTKVESRLNTYRAIVNARAWSVPVKVDNKIEFITIGEFLTESRLPGPKR